MKKIIIYLSFLALALGERLVFDLGPNVELVTTVMVLAGLYLGRGWSWRLVLPVILISDIVLGNSLIFLFTWTGFLLPAWLVGEIFKPGKGKFLKTILKGTAVGVGANLFFFAWTNFGVWLLDSFGMYERSLLGLGRCYFNGLPFLKMQLTGTVGFLALGLSAGELFREMFKEERWGGKSRVGEEKTDAERLGKGRLDEDTPAIQE